VPSFAEAKPKVEAAWKFIRARELAREEAKKLIAALKGRTEGTSADRFLRDEAARRGYEWYSPLTPVIKLDKVLDTGGGRAGPREYRPYAFDESRFPYPRPDTVEKLFQNLKELDDAIWLKDNPDRNYYVAVLLQKPVVPTEADFVKVYKGAPRSGFVPDSLPDSLWLLFQTERDEQYRTDVVKHFRGESQAPLDDDGSYKMDPEVRRRLASSRGDGEE